MTGTDLLAVLDTSKNEQQIKMLYEGGYIEYFAKLHCGRDGITYECKTGSLADLAFRLRDEVCNPKTYTNYCENYYESLEAIYNHRIKNKQCCSLCAFQTYQIRPIDMIIAALITKDKEND